MHKNICNLILYLFMFALNLCLHRFRNELTRSLINGNHFSSCMYTGKNFHSSVRLHAYSYIK